MAEGFSRRALIEPSCLAYLGNNVADAPAVVDFRFLPLLELLYWNFNKKIGIEEIYLPHRTKRAVNDQGHICDKQHCTHENYRKIEVVLGEDCSVFFCKELIKWLHKMAYKVYVKIQLRIFQWVVSWVLDINFPVSIEPGKLL